MAVTTTVERPTSLVAAVPERPEPGAVPKVVGDQPWRWVEDEPADTPAPRRPWLMLFSWAKVTGGW